jgi:molybdate/tungstate transport system ATP-binding protein
MSIAAIEVSDLSLKLGSFALRDFGLVLDEGEILVILGPNGAGKSVSLEAIAGFHRLRGGRILIGGRDVTRLPPERRHISLLFQNFGLFPHLSVAQNVAFGKRGTDPMRLLARFGIAPLAGEHPDTLSPGQKQRVALARALGAVSLRRAVLGDRHADPRPSARGIEGVSARERGAGDLRHA